MVGDSLTRDVIPALDAGLDAIWFNPDNKKVHTPTKVKQINSLIELCR